MADVLSQITGFLSVDFFGINPKILTVILLAVLYFAYEKFIGKKPYCYVRIKEKRGNSFVDHGTAYKAFIKKNQYKNGSVIRWLYISGINKVWRVPKSTEFSPTSKKNKLIELAWFGENTFQILKTDTFMYKKDKGQWKRIKANETNLRVVPQDLKYMDYELSTKIDELTSEDNWFDKYLKPYMTLLIVGGICFLMIYTSVNTISKEMGETREEMSSLGNKFVSYVTSVSNTKVDDNTIKSKDIENIGRDTND